MHTAVRVDIDIINYQDVISLRMIDFYQGSEVWTTKQ